MKNLPLDQIFSHLISLKIRELSNLDIGISHPPNPSEKSWDARMNHPDTPYKITTFSKEQAFFK